MHDRVLHRAQRDFLYDLPTEAAPFAFPARDDAVANPEPYGISAFAITPGPVGTPMMRQAVASPWIGHLYQDVVYAQPGPGPW